MSIILFFVALAILVLSHELGHFLAAKKSGIKVEEFGFGFPPRLFGVKRGETVYSLNLIPFGGFVKIFGEDSDKNLPRSFSSKSIPVRAIVLFAGVLFNVILAWILLSAVFFVGAPSSVGDSAQGKVTILEVQQNTPAEKAGLMSGDQILRVSFKDEILDAKTVAETQLFIKNHRGLPIKIDYLRGKEQKSAEATPDVNPETGKGALGIAMDKIGIVSIPIHKAVYEGLKTTLVLIQTIAESLSALVVSLVKGAGVSANVAGPVGIIGIVGTASEFGFVYVVQLVALLSINLAIINFMPFPALDGGRLLFLAIEAVRRKPISQKVFKAINSIGFFILIGLMLLITYRDIIKLIK
ncbi:MAG: site-2 protease family protein [bacterium]|nr:site-2 protease family protein [bacterium]